MGRLHDDAIRRQGRARRPPCGVSAISEGGLITALIPRYAIAHLWAGVSANLKISRFRVLWRSLSSGRALRGPVGIAPGMTISHHADCRVCQKLTTRSA